MQRQRANLTKGKEQSLSFRLACAEKRGANLFQCLIVRSGQMRQLARNQYKVFNSGHTL